MFKNIDLTPIIEALIALISAVITIFILPKVTTYLKEKLTAEQREKLKQYVQIAVAAAEQIYGSKKGKEKKDYVVSFLLSKGLVFDIDEVTALIESEVYKLTQGSGYFVAVPEDDPVLTGNNDNNCTEPSVPDEDTESDEADEECQPDTAEADNLFSVRNTCE